jgi:transposase
LIKLIRRIELEEFVHDYGCEIEYLPPYSPDYNPIEFSFSVIKKAVKNLELEGDEDIEEVAQRTVDLACKVVTEDMSKSQFRHCKIRVD